MRMHKRLENGVLHDGQQFGSAVNSFIDQGKFETMKTLSGCRALHCGKHQFRVKNGIFTTAHFHIQLSSMRLLGFALIVKATQLHHKYAKNLFKCSAFLFECFCLRNAYILHTCHPYIYNNLYYWQFMAVASFSGHLLLPHGLVMRLV